MFEIRENTRTLPDGKQIRTFSREVVSANILEVEAGSTGYRGGDSGHGGRTYFRIEDVGSTDIEVRTLKNAGNGGFEVFLGGDCELATIIDALKFITQALEDEAAESKDPYV